MTVGPEVGDFIRAGVSDSVGSESGDSVGSDLGRRSAPQQVSAQESVTLSPLKSVTLSSESRALRSVGAGLRRICKRNVGVHILGASSRGLQHPSESHR